MPFSRTDDRKARDVMLAEDFDRREDGSVGSDTDGRGCHDLMHVDALRPCLDRKGSHQYGWPHRVQAMDVMLCRRCFLDLPILRRRSRRCCVHCLVSAVVCMSHFDATLVRAGCSRRTWFLSRRFWEDEKVDERKRRCLTYLGSGRSGRVDGKNTERCLSSKIRCIFGPSYSTFLM